MTPRRRRRQVMAVLKMELAKSLFGRRAFLVYLTAAPPVLVCGMLLLASVAFEAPSEMRSPAMAANLYAVIFQTSLVFLYAGCVWIFMNLFRGEVLDRSLHYYFLTPIRRELLILGKFLAGWIAATVVFVFSTLLSIVLLYSYFGPSMAADHLLRGPGLGQWMGYVGVTMMACLGYGAVFLLVGLLFRNFVIPAVLIFLWEGLNPMLPSLLKKISVIFYLQSVLPVKVMDGPFTLIADPVSPWISVPGLILFTALTLVVAAVRIRHMEIAYSD